MNNSSYNNSYVEELTCRYCNKLCKNLNSLSQHEVRCPNNPDRRAFDNLIRYIQTYRKGQTKETCSDLDKQSKTMKIKYEKGYSNPTKGTKKHTPSYMYQQHNDEEISKWHKYLRELDFKFSSYNTSISASGYVIVRHDCQLAELAKQTVHEHVFLMKQILWDKLDAYACVHHLDENKSNNDIYNLIVFETDGDHKRYHNSKRAYLTYSEINNKFSCKCI